MKIIFDGPPGPEGGRFIEVEDDEGRSITIGEWHSRGDGTCELRIPDRPGEEVRRRIRRGRIRRGLQRAKP